MELKLLHLLQNSHDVILDKVMVGLSSLGNMGMIWIFITIIFLCLPKYRKCGITMAIALILDVTLCNLVLKNLVARSRPCWVDQSVTLLVANPKDYSFPSGHTAAAFASSVTIFYYHKREGIAALILAVLIAFSRLYLFVHYPTDVLGGIVIGVLAGIAAVCMLKKIDKKSRIYY